MKLQSNKTNRLGKVLKSIFSTEQNYRSSVSTQMSNERRTKRIRKNSC